MTVAELKKALRGLPDKMPVYIADHDHAEYEVNGSVAFAEVRDQEQAEIKEDILFKIKGKYFLIHG